jgi:hypothetical protein
MKTSSVFGLRRFKIENINKIELVIPDGVRIKSRYNPLIRANPSIAC